MKRRLCKRCGKVIARSDECCASRRQARNTTADGYDRKWQRFRRRLIQQRARQGTLRCGLCGGVFGAVSPHADHITPVHNQSDPLFFDPSNIQFLHPNCHGMKTAVDVANRKTR